MAKELYIPVNGFSKKTSKFYAPVNGFSKEIVKAYCSVNGFSKLFYEKGGGGGGAGFWFFYETEELTQIFWTQLYNRPFQKYNSGIAFFALFKYASSQGGGAEAYAPLLISTDRDAVTYRAYFGGWSPLFTARGSVTVNGDTWYWAGWSYAVYGQLNPYPTGYTPDCLLSDKNYYVASADTNNEVVQDILARIYSNDFAEDYQQGQTYNLPLGDIEKTIRKAIGIYLFKNATTSFKNLTCYNTLLNNVENIVTNILNYTYANDKILLYFQFLGGNTIQITVYYTSNSTNNITMGNYNEDYGYGWYGYVQYLQYYKYMNVIMDSTGNIQFTSGLYSGNMSRYVGCLLTKVFNSVIQDYYYTLVLSNIGLDL